MKNLGYTTNSFTRVIDSQSLINTSVHRSTYLRFAVFEFWFRHSSLDIMRCEKKIPSGSRSRAMVWAYIRTPNVQMCNSYILQIASRNCVVLGRIRVWYHILELPWGSWKWWTPYKYASFTLKYKFKYLTEN